MSIDRLVDVYVRIRNERSALERQRVALKKNMEVIEAEILKECSAQKVESFRTESGTAYKTSQDFIKVENWGVAFDFIVRNDLIHMLTQSIKKSAAKEYMEENNNELPPGLRYGSIPKIGIRAGK